MIEMKPANEGSRSEGSRHRPGQREQAQPAPEVQLSRLEAAGQRLRNAMTDNSGRSISRYLIRDNWDRVGIRANQLGANLTIEQRAQITAYIHNHGPSQLSHLIQNPAQAANDAYAQAVWHHW